MSTCCGTCQKRTGCILVGCLTVAACTGMTVQSSVNLATLNRSSVQVEVGEEEMPRELFLKLEIICLVLSVLGIVIGVIFIYGVWKDRPNFMIPFVVWFIITMIFAVLDTVHIVHHINKVYAALVVVAIPVCCYFVWLAWSHILERRTLRREEAVLQLALRSSNGNKERRLSWVQ